MEWKMPPEEILRRYRSIDPSSGYQKTAVVREIALANGTTFWRVCDLLWKMGVKVKELPASYRQTPARVRQKLVETPPVTGEKPAVRKVTLYVPPEQILADYKAAKSKRDMLRSLAEQNLMPVGEMRDWLKANGIQEADLPGEWRRNHG